MSGKRLVVHRKANNYETYVKTPRTYAAEGDLVSIKGKLYMFHPGGLFSFLIVRPLFFLINLFWGIWRKNALPYEELLRASNKHRIPIVLELKNVSVREITDLPASLAHIDTYDLELGRAVKNRFGCQLSLHTLWANTNGCLVVRSKKGIFRWHRWWELGDVDIITITYQLTPSRRNGAKFWKTVKQNSGKTIILGGGFTGRISQWVYGTDFNEIVKTVDGWYLR